MKHSSCHCHSTPGAVLLRIVLAAMLAAALLVSGVSAQSTRAPGAKPKPTSPPVLKKGRPTTPPDARGRTILAQASAYDGMKILVSTEDRWLWVVSARDTLLSVPVAVGMRKNFEWEGKKYWFETPRGKRKVLKKEPNPLWNVPEWHYFERAAQKGFGIVPLERDTKYLLADGTFILTIGDQVGRLNQYGNFYAFEPGTEIMFDDKVFIPPKDTKQRLVPEALGPYKLDTGEGYLIHGTHIYNEDSVGEAVSHGCVRMTNADLTTLYWMVPVGTPVYIF